MAASVMTRFSLIRDFVAALVVYIIHPLFSVLHLTLLSSALHLYQFTLALFL